MISKISGTIEEKYIDSVIVNVAGVGYEIYLGARNTIEYSILDKVSFYTHLSVSKDMDFKLYGFKSSATLSTFKLLCTVSGVGPKSAFSILANGDSKELLEAISNADKSYFKSVPGVGEKLAMKIIVELQSKVGKQKELEILSSLSDTDKDILQALASMGYDTAKSKELISKLDKNLTESEKLKTLINQMSK